MRVPLDRSLALHALVGGALLAGCSSGGAGAPPGCTMLFSGNVTGSVSLPAGCASLAPAAEAGSSGGTVLTVRASSTAHAGLVVSVDLGPSPSAGSYSPETVANWSALGLAGASSDCAYTAGSTAVPSGSFALDITSAGGAGGGALPEVHGSIDLQLEVHAPPATDCGPEDIENVTLTF